MFLISSLYNLNQWFFAPSGHRVVSGGIFVFHSLEKYGYLHLQARVAAKHPTLHRTDPTVMIHPAPNVDSAEAEKRPLKKGL